LPSIQARTLLLFLEELGVHDAPDGGESAPHSPIRSDLSSPGNEDASLSCEHKVYERGVIMVVFGQIRKFLSIKMHLAPKRECSFYRDPGGVF